MVRVASLKSTILANHTKKCRCCLKSFGRRNKQQRITKTIEIRFFELTSLEIQVLPGYSNVICESCNAELKRISEFRGELIFKQTCLSEHVDGESHVEEFVKIKIESDFDALDTLEDNTNFEPIVIKSEIFDDTLPNFYPAPQMTSPQTISPSPTVTLIKLKKKRPKPTIPLFCDHCGFSTAIKATLKDHVKLHIPKEFREKFPCTICDAVFISKQQFKRHTAEHSQKTAGFSVDSVFTCDLCSRHFSSELQLRNHKLSKHRDNRVECKICGRSQYDKYVLKKHMKRCHKDEIDDSVLSNKERGKIATGWMRNMKEEVKVPMKRKTTAKPVETRICDHCGKQVNRTVFHSHMRRQHHDGSKKFQCDHCPAFYFLKERMFQHMVKHIPRDVRQKYSCRICKKTFVSLLGKNNHIKLNHETTGKNFKCQFCGKTFISSTNLKAHIVRIHESRKIFCQDCNQGFVAKFELKKHILRYHSDNPGYNCDSCGRNFPTIEALRSHNKNIHADRRFACEHPGCSKKYPLLNQLKTHQKIHENQKEFICSFRDCGKSYFNGQRLRRHIGLVHENVRKPCPIDGCSFSVGRLDYMRNHLMKHTELEETEKQEYLKKIKDIGLL